MLKTSTIAFAAAATMLAATGADAMSLSSMSRQFPAMAADEVVTNSIPGQDMHLHGAQPKFQLIFQSIGTFLRQQQAAVAESGAATIQLITFGAR